MPATGATDTHTRRFAPRLLVPHFMPPRARATLLYALLALLRRFEVRPRRGMGIPFFSVKAVAAAHAYDERVAKAFDATRCREDACRRRCVGGTHKPLTLTRAYLGGDFPRVCEGTRDKVGVLPRLVRVRAAARHSVLRREPQLPAVHHELGRPRPRAGHAGSTPAFLAPIRRAARRLRDLEAAHAALAGVRVPDAGFRRAGKHGTADPTLARLPAGAGLRVAPLALTARHGGILGWCGEAVTENARPHRGDGAPDTAGVAAARRPRGHSRRDTRLAAGVRGAPSRRDRDSRGGFEPGAGAPLRSPCLPRPSAGVCVASHACSGR